MLPVAFVLRGVDSLKGDRKTKERKVYTLWGRSSFSCLALHLWQTVTLFTCYSELVHPACKYIQLFVRKSQHMFTLQLKPGVNKCGLYLTFLTHLNVTWESASFFKIIWWTVYIDCMYIHCNL